MTPPPPFPPFNGLPRRLAPLNRFAHPAQRAAGGFAAVAAIFLVLVFAAMAAYMLTFSNTAQINSAQDLQSSRAYWAARAGLEWGMARASTTNAAGVVGCPTLPSPLTVEGFTVAVTCTQSTYTEARILQITSIATLGGAPGALGYVERSVTSVFEV
jgi:MSHA biogenesis protein MshP